MKSIGDHIREVRKENKKILEVNRLEKIIDLINRCEARSRNGESKRFDPIKNRLKKYYDFKISQLTKYN